MSARSGVSQMRNVPAMRTLREKRLQQTSEGANLQTQMWIDACMALQPRWPLATHLHAQHACLGCQLNGVCTRVLNKELRAKMLKKSFAMLAPVSLSLWHEFGASNSSSLAVRCLKRTSLRPAPHMCTRAWCNYRQVLLAAKPTHGSSATG